MNIKLHGQQLVVWCHKTYFIMWIAECFANALIIMYLPLHS